jgi:hypothetical protein
MSADPYPLSLSEALRSVDLQILGALEHLVQSKMSQNEQAYCQELQAHEETWQRHEEEQRAHDEAGKKHEGCAATDGARLAIIQSCDNRINQCDR